MYLGFQKRISPKLGFFGAVLAFGRGILSHYRSAGMASAPGAQPAHLSQPGSFKDMFAGWSGLLVPGISPDYAGVVGYDRTSGRISVLSMLGDSAMSQAGNPGALLEPV